MRGTFKSSAAVVVALALLAGCGGSSSSSTSHTTAEFKTSYASVVNQLKQSARAIGAAVQQAPKQTDAQISSAFQNLASRWRDNLSQLQRLRPPSNLAAIFNTLAASASLVEADLNAIVAAAETHSGSAARQAGASLVSDILRAKAASTVITQKLGAK